MGMAVRPAVGLPPRGCEGKVKYPSQIDAADGLIRLVQRLRDGTAHARPHPQRPLNIYLCSHCSHWHIGHVPEYLP